MNSLEHVPNVLEVGVDRGVTLVPITVFLARTREEFNVIGVDVLVQEQLKIVLCNLDLTQSQSVKLIEDNSLAVLPMMCDAIRDNRMSTFDIVFLDGDHNYHTVSRELEHLDGLTRKGSIVLIDDYCGRWADKDLWYSERPEYSDNDKSTARVDTEKHGVKAAVDEYLGAYPNTWHSSQPIKGEPILLVKLL